jgi:endonuclease/exonuclease/phosphatase (EEP) superfamily protein YafD
MTFHEMATRRCRTPRIQHLRCCATCRRGDGPQQILLVFLLVAIPNAAVNAAAQSIRIATYNVAGGAQYVPAIVATISQAEPDVVAIQELSPAGAQQLDHALATTLPFRFFPKPSQGGGLALASRLPVHQPRYRASLHGGNGFILAEVEIDGRIIQVANLHLDPIKVWTLRQKFTLPWQLLRHRAVHHRELARVCNELQPDATAIVVGDLNSYGGNAAPAWLLARGFIDSFDSVATTADDSTTHHFTIAGLHLSGRIDFIFHTPDLHTLNSQIVRGGASDHDLVVSTLHWARR